MDRLVHLQLRNIHVQMARNVARQALDLDLAQHMLQNAALALDAHRHAGQLDRHRHPNRLVHCNPLQVDVQQRALDRLMLPVDNHRLHRRRTRHIQIEDGVVAGVGVQNPGDDARVHGHRDRLLPGTVDHRGNLARRRARGAPHSC